MGRHSTVCIRIRHRTHASKFKPVPPSPSPPVSSPLRCAPRSPRREYKYDAATLLTSLHSSSRHQPELTKVLKPLISGAAGYRQAMAKPVSGSGRSQRDLEAEIGGVKYKGVRKRKWGRWVSEIRLPNSRERIWLGSYDTQEKAARAYDAAVFCLRGRNARFNFPHNPPEISAASSLSPTQIQVAAAQFANSAAHAPDDDAREHPSASESSQMSDVAAAAAESGMGSSSAGIDWPYLDWLLEDSSESGFSLGRNFSMSFDEFSGDFVVPPVVDLEEEEAGGLGYPDHQPLLWTF